MFLVQRLYTPSEAKRLHVLLRIVNLCKAYRSDNEGRVLLARAVLIVQAMRVLMHDFATRI
jgi:hypothetical protein